jgi:hypothetical protein
MTGSAASEEVFAALLDRGPIIGVRIRLVALRPGIAKSRMDRAATVSKAEGVDVARKPRHLSTPAQSVPTSSSARAAMISVFRVFISIALAYDLPVLFSGFYPYLASVELSPPSFLLDRLHNPQYWMAVDVLQWEIDEVGLWIDRYRMCVRHLQGAEQTKAFSVALEDGDCP